MTWTSWIITDMQAGIATFLVATDLGHLDSD
jgi:hypothetical protein